MARINKYEPLDLAAIGARLKELREKKDVSLRRMSLQVPFTWATIKEYENGDRAPSAEALNVYRQYSA